MIKKLFTKFTVLCCITICIGAQEIRAQESSERELRVESFKEADKSDFDVTSPSNFSGSLKTCALVKVFMPGEIESTDPVSAKDIERKLSPGGGNYAYYLWIKAHSNTIRIIPKGNLYQSILIELKNYDIPLYSPRNKNGGLKAGTVYHLVLRDPTPVYIDTHLQGSYACVDDDAQKVYADINGRITLKNLTAGEHIVSVFASDGSTRGSIKIDDRQKIYTIDARKKTPLDINTNPSGGLIYIMDGESQEQYDRSKEYAYGSYKVIAHINGNIVEKSITVDDRHRSFTIDNTKTYNITPMYMGSSTSATVYENNKQLVAGEDNGVELHGYTYQITRPIGGSYKYYATNYNGKSKKTKVNVSNNSQSDYQLSLAARNTIVWPWQREYDAAPMGITFGYVQKQMITQGNGEKLKENGVWDDGADKWLHGMQIGIIGQPCFSWGLGLYTGLSYEFYMSMNDNNYGYDSFMEHNLVIPVHALYRLPLGRKCAISLHGGLGLGFVVYGAYKGEDYEDYTDFYGEEAYPKRVNLAVEGGLDLRFGPVQVGFIYSKGINDHGSYSFIGDYKTTYKKIGLNVAWVIGSN